MKKRDPLFLLLLILCIVYAALWTANGSFLLNGTRWFTLFDDAMISMRYAHNLWDGFGLVWNPEGPRVEGYTNFLWVVYMAALHTLPVSPEKISLLVQITNAALMLCVVVYARRLAHVLTGEGRGAGLCAATLTAFYYSLAFWSWSGLETTASTLILTGAAFASARDISQKRTVSWPPFLYLALGTFLRPDMIVPLVLLTGYAAWAVSPAERRHLLERGLGLTFLCAAVQTGFRLWYFHAVLPNTYYLKMDGYPPLLRIGRGLWEMSKFTVQGWGLPVLAPYFAIKGATVGRKARGLLSVLWAGQFAYNIYTGGDAWEYWGHASRFVTAGVPLLMVLIACTVNDLFQRRIVHTSSQVRAGSRAWVGATMILLLVMNMLYYPPMAREMAKTFILRPARAAEAVPGDDDAAFARSAVLLDDLTEPSATVAVMRAGITPYFAGRTTFDLLGKCDAHIAHESMHRWTKGGRRTVTDFVPGHMKWDWNYTVNVQKPDVIADAFAEPDKQAAMGGRYMTLQQGNVTLHLRLGSPRIRWGVVKRLVQTP